ncbi:hypothetical protein [Candidimonas nitroreducens]|uniref:Uncharacterized protein n=1 Tax=Candidimonas nitroreducens TaxID=683354 RepID=A0A225MM24_9BURK|nr:hypothetical protein [Candidimonas nitroreducens]OWT62022.1 hypothetical protein CEY11_09460 [Candidimonas nitroreducens]
MSTLEGGGKGGSAPSYPDPYQVADATTQTNQASAAYNKALNLNNNTNAFGSQTTTQTGTDPNTGAPIYTTSNLPNSQLAGQINSLLGQAGNSGAINNQAMGLLNGLTGTYGQNSQNAQTLFNNAQNLQGGLLGLGSQYSGLNSSLAGLGSTLSPEAAQNAQQQGQDAAYKASMGYLQPQFNQQTQSLSAQLANQGIQAGSQAYTNATQNLGLQQGQQQQEALNNAVLTGSQMGTQNLQNQIAGINTQAGLLGQQASNLAGQGGLYTGAGQINSGSALGINAGNSSAAGLAGLAGQMSGLGQVPYSDLGYLSSLVPGYSGTGSSSSSPADIAGYTNNAYQSQLANYNANVQSQNSMMNGLMGLGAAGMLAFL